MSQLPGSVISNYDQAEAAMLNMAKLVSEYYDELVKGGIPPNVAAAFAIDFQRRLMTGNDNG